MAYLSLGELEPELVGNGPVFVAHDASVIGQIVLHEDCNIWFGAVLRGDNEPIIVGERTNIQEHSMLHTDMGFPLTIGADCTIGHRAILHGCTIADNSLIGMGAIVLNGSKIGRNCLVGAGALVTEGKEFPDNSLIVGSPARAVRTLDANAAKQLTASAAHYVDNGRRFAADMKPV
ncbi:MAG: gamma carbonic anhydrase family protein [Pseudomonadota bacterium]